jgi:hypothetical protein
MLSMYLCVAFDSKCAATIILIVSTSLIFDVSKCKTKNNYSLLFVFV